jgi:hypothetical protein
MNSAQSPQTSSSSDPLKAIPSGLLIGAATVPMLAGIIAGKALAQIAQDLGQLSEEFFRGDRLPLLKFPAQDSPAPDASADD